jgi:hypothetical protein
MLYVLVDVFRPKSSFATKRRNRSSSFQAMPVVGSRNSVFLLGPPRFSEPKFNPMFGEGLPFPEVQRSEESSQVPYVARISSWLGRKPSRSNRAVSPEERDNLWAHDQAEKGSSRVTDSVEVKLSHQSRSPSPGHAELQVIPDVHDSGYSAAHPAPAPIITSEKGSTVEPFPTVPPRVYTRDLDKQYLYPSTSNSESNGSSPIHGLYGIVNPKSPMMADVPQTDEDPRQLFDNSARSSAISTLLRQQAELDKSIAALQLFNLPGGEDSRRSSIDTSTPKGSANFSLSNFPAPPWGRESIASAEPVDTRVVTPVIQLTGEATSLQMPERPRQQSIPLSEVSQRNSDGLLTPLGGRDVRTNSAGTQYEITSFIGRKY